MTEPHELKEIKHPVIAFPRNFLHVQLLEDNFPEIDFVAYREAFMRPRLEQSFPAEKLLDIGREMRPGLNGWNLFKIRRFNRRYYDRTLKTFADKNPATIIIFLENEPMEVALIDYFGIQNIELWEEGVMHYVDMFDPLFFKARRLVQIAMGYYGAHPWRTRLNRSDVIVRDRFDKQNLSLSIPKGEGKVRDEIAFVANVMFGDGLISKSKYIKTLQHMAAISNSPIIYLPHPREDREFVRYVANTMRDTNLTVHIPEQGTLQYCADFEFKAYISPFSTTLLDLQKFDKSYWIPEVFGLRSYTKALHGTDMFPIKLLSPNALDTLLSA